MVAVAAAVAGGHRLGTQVEQLLGGVLVHVTGAGDQTDLAFQVVILDRQHLGGEVHRAVAGRLRTHQGTTPIQALPGQHPGEFILEFAVLAGILISFAVYLLKTGIPRVVAMLPNKKAFLSH